MFELLEIQKFNWDFFSSSAGVPMKPDISISPCMALLPNVVTHK